MSEEQKTQNLAQALQWAKKARTFSVKLRGKKLPATQKMFISALELGLKLGMVDHDDTFYFDGSEICRVSDGYYKGH
jgi:hypothetical protein